MRIVDTAKLRYYMAKSGCRSAADLSRATGVNRVTVSGVMNGTVLPSSEVMDKIIIALNIPLAEAGEVFFAKKLA